MRLLGVDFGRKRIGLALSDADGRLARPWQVVAAGATPAASATVVAGAIAEFARSTLGSEHVDAIVVGLPRRLNGDDNEQTAPAKLFAERLGAASGLPIFLQDERLTSHEADMRLREREPDWRARKKKLDSAAAAIILQDYLDAQTPRRPDVPMTR